MITASDGVDTLEIFDRERGAIDLVVSDAAMPRMKETEMARRLAERNPRGAGPPPVG